MEHEEKTWGVKVFGSFPTSSIVVAFFEALTDNRMDEIPMTSWTYFV